MRTTSMLLEEEKEMNVRDLFAAATVHNVNKFLIF